MEVEIKPRFVKPVEQLDQYPDSPTIIDMGQAPVCDGTQHCAESLIGDQNIGGGFWNGLYKYKVIIFYSIIFTILLCSVIYYFWKENPMQLQSSNSAAVTGQASAGGFHSHANNQHANGGVVGAQQVAPQSIQQKQAVSQSMQPQETQKIATQFAQPPIKKPPVDLTSIINKTKENINNMENQDDEVERQYLSSQENNTIIIACLAADESINHDNNEKVVEVFDNSAEENHTEENHAGENIEDITMENTIENTIDSIGMSIEPKTIPRCNFVFKNKRVCGGKTNGGDKCSKHMNLK